MYKINKKTGDFIIEGCLLYDNFKGEEHEGGMDEAQAKRNQLFPSKTVKIDESNTDEIVEITLKELGLTPTQIKAIKSKILAKIGG